MSESDKDSYVLNVDPSKMCLAEFLDIAIKKYGDGKA